MENLEIEIKIKLNEKYMVDLNFGWFPINNMNNPKPGKIEAFQIEYIENNDAILKDAIKKIFNPERVFTLIECEGMEVNSIESCDFYYDGLERMTTDIEGNFCIYSSHESSVTIGSDLILKELKARLDGIEKYIWNTPFYE